MRRPLILTLVSLASLGGVAFATHAIQTAGEQARFTFSITPVRQSAVQGGAVSFSVKLVRAKGFTGPTAFRLEGLPRGVRPRWQLADGTPSALVPPAETGAILTLHTSARTPLGTRVVKVVATGGGASRARELTLTVGPRTSRYFTLKVRPARQTVPRGTSASYNVRVARATGFRKRVRLRALGLSRGATATWAATTLAVASGRDQRLGSDQIVVEGISRAGGTAIRRYAVIVLTIADARPFAIGGDLDTLLYPGASAPLDIVLTNPHPFDIRVIALSVNLGAGTSNPHCSAPANYAVTQYSGGYPLVLPPGSTQLSSLAPHRGWPRVWMHDLPTNQDGCKGAVLSLHYNGQAIR